MVCYIQNVCVYVSIYVRVKAPPRVCMENTVRGGGVERLIQHEAKPSAVFASRHPSSTIFFIHKQGGALSVILYFLRLARSDFL